MAFFSRCLSGAAVALCLCLPSAAAAQDAERQLRVCSDPNNMPFSNRKGEGYENRIASILADELGADLSYFWWPQRRGFIRKTLKAGNCDLVIGVPAGYEMVDTTAPYYASTYVWVYRDASHLDLHSMRDPRLSKLRIAVHLIGDDGNNSPPAHALGDQGIVDNVSGYLIYDDYRSPTPTARPVEAVASGKADTAAVWGPIGSYYAHLAETPLVVEPITDTEAFRPLRFEFPIAMGVRKGDDELLEEVQAAIDHRRSEIEAVLKSYHVPLVPIRGESYDEDD